MLTPEEKRVIELLAEAWNAYVLLPVQHGCDRSEFCKAIHDAQYRVAARVARRADPNFWSIDPLAETPS